MKALLLEDHLRLAYVDLPVPEPGPEDVLVAVRACGICGSDVHGIDGSTGRRKPPLVMGHEASGVVAGVGAHVTDWREGDRVAVDSTLYCGECSYCREARTNLCTHRSVLGAATDLFRHDGAFADYVAVPGRVLSRVPDAIGYEQAALAEPLSVALHAVGLAGAAGTVAVVGTGMIGLLVVQALRAVGVARVVAVDVDPARLEFARLLGADATVTPDAVDAAIAADVAIEAVGTTPAISTALSCVRRGGRVVLIGNVAPTIELPLQHVITSELTMTGSCASSGEFAAALDLLASGAIDVAPLISTFAPLREGAAWFDRLYRAEPGLMKVILVPDGGTR